MADSYEGLALMVIGDGKIHVAMELDYVRELVRDVSITNLPCVPDCYEGICNWKGKIIPVVSLQRAGELPEVEGDGSGVIIILQVEDLECGFLIGNEPEITTVNPENRLDGEVPDKIGGLLVIKQAYSDGNRVLPLLDLPATMMRLIVYE